MRILQKGQNKIFSKRKEFQIFLQPKITNKRQKKKLKDKKQK